MRTEVAGLNERLRDRRVELSNVQRQLELARTQFEHYQDATAQQRAEELRQYEQAKQLSDTELVEARRQLASRDLALSTQRHEITELQQGARRAADKLAAGTKRRTLLERECHEHQRRLGEQLAFVAQLDTRLQVATAGLSEANSELAALRGERHQMGERAGILEAKFFARLLAASLIILSAVIHG